MRIRIGATLHAGGSSTVLDVPGSLEALADHVSDHVNELFDA